MPCTHRQPETKKNKNKTITDRESILKEENRKKLPQNWSEYNVVGFSVKGEKLFFFYRHANAR